MPHCSVCSFSASSKEQLRAHRYTAHQQRLDVRLSNGVVYRFERSEDDCFHCTCDEYSASSLYSFRYHLLNHCRLFQVPTESTFVELEGAHLEGSPLFRSLGLVWNALYGCLICFKCEKIIEKEKIWHAKTDVPSIIDAGDYASVLTRCWIA